MACGNSGVPGFLRALPHHSGMRPTTVRSQLQNAFDLVQFATNVELAKWYQVMDLRVYLQGVTVLVPNINLFLGFSVVGIVVQGPLIFVKGTLECCETANEAKSFLDLMS